MLRVKHWRSSGEVKWDIVGDYTTKWDIFRLPPRFYIHISAVYVGATRQRAVTTKTVLYYICNVFNVGKVIKPYLIISQLSILLSLYPLNTPVWTTGRGL